MRTCIVLPSDQSFMADKTSDWSVRMINHGIALLIAYAQKQGFEIEFIDTRRLVDWNDYIEKVKEFDVVCFSVSTVNFGVYKHALDLTKTVNPKSIVIVGGVHPTVKLSDFINDMSVDYIIQGEGEVALTKLLSYIKKSVRDIPRIHQREVVKLDNIPFINRNLWQQEFPVKLKFAGQPPFVTILASRACTMNCSFCQPCSRLIFGNDERRRSVANVIQELVLLDETYHFKSWMIHDDGFLQNLSWIKEFLEAYKNKGFGPRPLIIQCRANYVVEHPELIKELKDVLGLDIAIVGFESGSDSVLKALRKGTTRKINLEAAKILHKNNIKIFANIMLGVPGETKEDVDLTMSMVKEINPVHFSPATFSPYPGSDLHDYCLKNNLILDEYSDRHVGQKKLKGIDYDYIQRAVDKYTSDKHPVKFWLKHTNLPLAKTARKIYRKIR
jgi:anaerobic magnesium-protoporphyrin IX monomethyl ester cyclase